MVDVIRQHARRHKKTASFTLCSLSRGYEFYVCFCFSCRAVSCQSGRSAVPIEPAQPPLAAHGPSLVTSRLINGTQADSASLEAVGSAIAA